MTKDHDLIYRREALEVIETSADLIRRALDCTDLVGAERDKFEWGLGLIEPLIYDMESLPSAHPSATDTNVGDMISRQAAVRLVKTECNPYGKPTLDFESGKKVIEHLEQIPSAQPKQKPGKWIYGEDEYGIDGYHCDECGFFVPWDYAHKFINYIEDYNFCPHCGADMRGEQP